MNEYQRQAYLSALGVDNYMPRWRLPFAPNPVVCEMPEVPPEPYAEPAPTSISAEAAEISATSAAPTSIDEVLRNITGEQKPARSASLKPTLASTATVLEKQKAPILKPFSLSIWRPQASVLVLAERQARSALPVEPLIHNILRSLFADPSVGGEEVLRWPLVENARVSHTAEDARIALQTWLEAELARRPVSSLWLMGSNAYRYFLPDSPVEKDLWQQVELDGVDARALITPDPVAILQQPSLKRQLWLALQQSLLSVR